MRKTSILFFSFLKNPQQQFSHKTENYRDYKISIFTKLKTVILFLMKFYLKKVIFNSL